VLVVVSLYAAVKVMFATAIYITYGIQFYVPIEILWPALQQVLVSNNCHSHQLLTEYGEYLLRYFFLFVTCECSLPPLHFTHFRILWI